ncbi:MAG: glucose 1-dehydrogenase [Alphaproteobacteria bacterium]|nr:glucose 1-dehydrogenase [Alphaproteobacteria bacterium]
MSKLKGKVAVVTGASKGIGAGIARALAAEGAAVAVNYASSRAGADKVVADIEKAGGKAVAIQGDMSKIDDVTRLFAETKQALGTPNVLVNNAGVYQFDALENVKPDEFHRQFNTNVLGPILAAKEAAVYFGEDGGSIINVSSVVSTRAFPQSVVYSATKGALDSVTRVLAAELGSKNIRVNTLAPGMIETEGTHAAGVIGSDFEAQAKASTPLGRIGQPDDIAKIAIFLASDESGWVTGERIEGAGGYP